MKPVPLGDFAAAVEDVTAALRPHGVAVAAVRAAHFRGPRPVRLGGGGGGQKGGGGRAMGLGGGATGTRGGRPPGGGAASGGYRYAGG